RDLKVWQMGLDLCPVIYRLVKELPREENYALGDQLRRAVVSIPANIAEGHSRRQTKAFLNHLAIASGSLAELDTLLEVAERLNYIAAADADNGRERIGDLRRALSGLRASLRTKLVPAES